MTGRDGPRLDPHLDGPAVFAGLTEIKGAHDLAVFAFDLMPFDPGDAEGVHAERLFDPEPHEIFWARLCIAGAQKERRDHAREDDEVCFECGLYSHLNGNLMERSGFSSQSRSRIHNMNTEYIAFSLPYPSSRQAQALFGFLPIG